MTKLKIPHFRDFGSEDSQVTESYERKVHGVPELGQQREYSYNTYTERKTYGRDENGEIVVRIEKDPKEPVRPVSPVRPVTPVEPVGSSVASSKDPSVRHLRINETSTNRSNRNGYRHPGTPVQPFDTFPLSIPRIEIDKTSNDAFSPRSYRTTTATENNFYEHHSPRSEDSLGYISQSTTHSGGSARTLPQSPRMASPTAVVPLKKITKESRWVSVHDGRPVSPYVRTVAYVPKYSDQEYVAGMMLYNDRNRNAHGYTQTRQVTYEDERYSPRNNSTVATTIRTSSYDPCSIFIENPLYRD